MRTAEYLDLAKKKANLPSDYALSQKLEATRQAVSKWRNGGTPEPLFAVRIAALAQVDPITVIGDIEIEKAEKAHREGTAEAWRSILGRVGGVAAAVMMGTVISSPNPSHASQVNKTSNSLYIVES